MIDFVSTRAGVDPATRNSAQFLASVVAQFVRQASSGTTQSERKTCRNSVAAQEALLYLFGHNSPFEDHIALLGGDATAMREALLSDRALGAGAHFDLAARNNIQLRHHWWVTAGRPQAAADAAPSTNPIPQGEPA